jgi:hypothetical protein
MTYEAVLTSPAIETKRVQQKTPLLPADLPDTTCIVWPPWLLSDGSPDL